MWRKLWNDSDWAIIICTFLLVCIGLAAIGSATHVNQEPIGFGSLVVKQLIFFLANAAVVIGMQFLNYHRLKDWVPNGGFNWVLLPFSHQNFLNY